MCGKRRENKHQNRFRERMEARRKKERDESNAIRRVMNHIKSQVQILGKPFSLGEEKIRSLSPEAPSPYPAFCTKSKTIALLDLSPFHCLDRAFRVSESLFSQQTVLQGLCRDLFTKGRETTRREDCPHPSRPKGKGRGNTTSF